MSMTQRFVKVLVSEARPKVGSFDAQELANTAMR